MRSYTSGDWGFSLVWGLDASVFPRAICLAIPNAILTFLLSEFYINKDLRNADDVTTENAIKILASFTSVLFFVLYFRSNIAYDRWWEGGTLLQKTRGEWFNAYSSLMAFTSTDVAKEKEVEEYQHCLARLMSLLFCCGLQQVSPNKDRPFEIIDHHGIDPKSLEFLSQSEDKVEVILQWIQRSTVLHMGTGVLPVAPPVLSRAFQEVSRGIVNLQNARKIADFPFPFPFAQTSMVMLLIHWACTPVLCAQMMAVAGGAWHGFLAAALSFCVIFFIWCINYIALQLEMPFGSAANDLPMNLMQKDWNKSVATLLSPQAKNPPSFKWDPIHHRKLELTMSDGSEKKKKRITLPENALTSREIDANDLGDLGGFNTSSVVDRVPTLVSHEDTSQQCKSNRESESLERSEDSGTSEHREESSSARKLVGQGEKIGRLGQDLCDQGGTSVEFRLDRSLAGSARTLDRQQFKTPEDSEVLVRAAPSMPSGSVILDMKDSPQAKVQEAPCRAKDSRRKAREEPQREEKLMPPLFPNPHVVDAAGFDIQLRMVGVRMKELHACLIDEELNLLSALGTRLVSTEGTAEKPGKVFCIGI